MISVVLVKPSHPGNIGAVARAMKNFGLKNLVLIDPKCKIDEEAKKRAKHANDILKKTKVIKFEDLKKFHTVIATTAKLGSDYNIPRSPLHPDQLADKIKNIKRSIAIVFGPEDMGLTNKELEYCDFIVTIPSNKTYPVLNLSHAANIIFYEIFKAKEKDHTTSHILLATKNEKDQIDKNVNKILNQMQFATTSKKQTQIVIWKRIIGKSFLTKREAFALIGFFKKLIK